ncbi:cleavage stimulation factor subunit 77 isoform X2 [Pistacia vera]|nr:cleavage stimulation factor subunit 77 isoform X2 [Pistacia vera]
MTAVRKAYQKAIVTPTHHVEQLWKDYENFENSVSRQLAKGLLSDYQPKYNSARAVYRERKKYVDEIDWNMLAVPPTGSYKEELQWMAWKRLLAFEKGNPQRIDNALSNKRIIFTYEQCLMYLYHYPDIWYDYAIWHAKSGSVDAAIKVFQRSLKALPDSEMLRYAFAELEESRGAIQAAKNLYESLLADGVNATALAHIQFIRFLRRNEGVEAARKYFLDARKSPNFTYHVYVAYALMAFCLDKDPKVAHNVFEAGLKRFMHEPMYILEYADFLSRLNDDRNIRALFERALSSLPPEESIEVWKRFTQFEQMYGDLDSMLKVEQRRKEALSRTGEEGATALEGSLQDVVSRYSFMDLWPCSSKDLDHLVRQEWLAKNVNKKVDKTAFPNGPGVVSTDRGPSGLPSNSTTSAKVIYPDTSQMAIYDPRQKPGIGISPSTTSSGAASNMSNPMVAMVGSGTMNTFDEILKATPPALVAFLANLPAVEGPTPNVDVVLSICLQSDIPRGQTGKSGTFPAQTPAGPAISASDVSGSTRSHPVPSGSSFKQTRDKQSLKRKDLDRQDEDETTTVQSQPLPRDVFRIRQMRKARGSASSQTGSASYGSALSGDLSGSTG